MVGSVDVVPEAVVRIEASGDAHEPITGEPYHAWAGSGFIIGDDGTAVTNVHVAAQAESLTAYVNGDTTGVPVKVLVDGTRVAGGMAMKTF